MADEILSRDQNHITVLGGVTDDSNQYVTMLRVDPTTKRLLVSATGLPGEGTVTSVSVATANGFAGTVATATSTPVITLTTTVTGLLKGNGTLITAATAGTDYLTAASTNTFTNKTFDTAGTGNSFLINGTVISDITGAGKVVLQNTPTLITPVIGAATGTSLQLSGLTASRILSTDVSKNLTSLDTATYPSLTELSYVKGVTSSIQTQLNAKGAGTVTTVSVTTANGVSGVVANATTTPAITLTLGAITPTTVNGVTFTGSGTATLALGTKTLTVSNTLTLAGTDSTTMTFPTTSATIARTDAGNTFTGVSTGTAWVLTSPTITTKISPTTDDGAPLGDTTHNFSDLFLATGAAINFANGNVVLNHTSGVLTVGTGDLRITTAGTNAGSVVTIAGTQTLTNKTLTAPVIATIVNSGTLTLPTSTDTLVGRATTDTLTNKSIAETQITFTNITTGDVSTSKHGFTPKLPNDATKFLDGTGAYTTPSGGSSYSVNAEETVIGFFTNEIPITVGAGGTTLANGYYIASNAGIGGISGSLLGTTSAGFTDAFEWDGTKIVRLQDTFSVDVGASGSTSGASVGFGFAEAANSLDLANNNRKIAILADSTGVMFGVTSDGSATTSTTLGVAYTRKAAHRCVIVWDPTIPNAKFYIDGVLKVTSTTNLPTNGTQTKVGISTITTVSGISLGRFTIPILCEQI